VKKSVVKQAKKVVKKPIGKTISDQKKQTIKRKANVRKVGSVKTKVIKKKEPK
jgi:hypothetical protein